MISRFRFEVLMYVYNTYLNRIPSHIIRRLVLTRLMGVQLGRGAAVLLRLRLYTRGGITIGDHSVIDRDCVIDGRGGVVIGANVNLAPEAMVLTASHDPDDDRHFGGVLRQVVIDDYAWIATRAVVLPDVHVGRAAVVAAGSVVTADVDPRAVVGGNPARFIRNREGEQAYKLSYRRWFN